MHEEEKMRERSKSTSRQTSLEPEQTLQATADSKKVLAPEHGEATPSISGYTSQENTVTKLRAQGKERMNFEDLKQQLDQLQTRYKPSAVESKGIPPGSQSSSVPTTPHVGAEQALVTSTSTDVQTTVSASTGPAINTTQTPQPQGQQQQLQPQHPTTQANTAQQQVPAHQPQPAHHPAPQTVQPQAPHQVHQQQVQQQQSTGLPVTAYHVPGISAQSLATLASREPSLSNLVSSASHPSITSQHPNQVQPNQVAQTQPTSVLQTVPSATHSTPYGNVSQAILQQLNQQYQSQYSLGQAQLQAQYLHQHQQLQHQQQQHLQQYQHYLGQQYQIAQHQLAQQLIGQHNIQNPMAAAQMMQQAQQQQMLAANVLSPRKINESQGHLDAGLIPTSLVSSSSGIMHPPQTLPFQPMTQSTHQLPLATLSSSVPSTPPKSVISTSAMSDNTTKPRRPPDLANLEQALIEKLHGNRKSHFYLGPQTPMSHYVQGHDMATTPSHIVAGHVNLPPANTPVGVSPVLLPNSNHLATGSIRTPATPAKSVPASNMSGGYLESHDHGATVPTSSSYHLSDSSSTPLTASSSTPAISTTTVASHSGTVPASSSVSAPVLSPAISSGNDPDHTSHAPSVPASLAKHTESAAAATTSVSASSTQNIPVIAPETSKDNSAVLRTKSSKSQTRTKGRFSVTVVGEYVPPTNEKPVAPPKDNTNAPKEDTVDGNFVKPVGVPAKAASKKRTARKGRFQVTTVKEAEPVKPVEKQVQDTQGSPAVDLGTEAVQAPPEPARTASAVSIQNPASHDVTPPVSLPQPAASISSSKTTPQPASEGKHALASIVPASEKHNVDSETQTANVEMTSRDVYNSAIAVTTSNVSNLVLPPGPQASATAGATNQVYSAVMPDASLNQVKSNVSTFQPHLPASVRSRLCSLDSSELGGNVQRSQSPSDYSSLNLTPLGRSQSLACLAALPPASPITPLTEFCRTRLGTRSVPNLLRQRSLPCLHEPLNINLALYPDFQPSAMMSWNYFPCHSLFGPAMSGLVDVIDGNPLDFHHTLPAAVLPQHPFEVSS